MKRLLLIAPLAAFLGLVLFFAVGLTRNPNEIPSVLIDQPAPAFSLPPLPGQEGGLATGDLRGEVQLVNVFASWCAPCKIEHPVLMRLAREEGVRIHGINYKDEPDAAQAWLRESGNPYVRIGTDRDGRAGIEWGVYGIPETFVIDREGRIRYRHVGPVTPRDAEERILPILRELKGS